MVIPNGPNYLARVEEHIAEGEKLLAAQEERLRALESEGLSLSDAKELYEALSQSVSGLRELRVSLICRAARERKNNP